MYLYAIIDVYSRYMRDEDFTIDAFNAIEV